MAQAVNMIPELESDDASSAERDRLSLEEEEEFNKHSKWRQAVLAVVVHGLGRNESARVFKVEAKDDRSSSERCSLFRP